MSGDHVNGFFELIGGIMIFMNVRQIWRDREIKGVHWGPTVFFTSWGYWNLYYYPSLGQWFSFAGGVLIVVANTIWITLIFYFIRKSDGKI